MKGKPVPWNRVFQYLADLADEKPSSAEYAMRVRKLHDVLVEETGDTKAVRKFLLLFHTSALYHRGRISKRHRELVVKLLPKLPRQKHRRPKGALGNKAYIKRHQLYLDWICEKTFTPSLTKDQFAKRRLGITEAQFDEDFDPDPNSDGPLHRKVKAILQELKPARMKRLDEGQRRALKIIYPLIITYDQRLAVQWREAKQQSPALTKEDFLQEFFGWVKHFGRVRTKKELHFFEVEMIDEYLKKLDESEKLLADSKRG